MDGAIGFILQRLQWWALALVLIGAAYFVYDAQFLSSSVLAPWVALARVVASGFVIVGVCGIAPPAFTVLSGGLAHLAMRRRFGRLGEDVRTVLLASLMSGREKHYWYTHDDIYLALVRSGLIRVTFSTLNWAEFSLVSELHEVGAPFPSWIPSGCINQGKLTEMRVRLDGHRGSAMSAMYS